MSRPLRPQRERCVIRYKAVLWQEAATEGIHAFRPCFSGKVHYKVHGGALVIKDQQSAPWKEWIVLDHYAVYLLYC